MVLLDMAWRIDPGIRVITVDSGRLHQETYDLIDQVRERYGIPIEVYSPEAAELEALRRRARPQSPSTAAWSCASAAARSARSRR